jgi:Pyruvate/2-oxoacid:ferredoxin oxidoreductase gamma subunit
VKASVPSGTEELNLKAFEAGWRFFQDEYAVKGKKEEAVASAPGA